MRKGQGFLEFDIFPLTQETRGNLAEWLARQAHMLHCQGVIGTSQGEFNSIRLGLRNNRTNTSRQNDAISCRLGRSWDSPLVSRLHMKPDSTGDRHRHAYSFSRERANVPMRRWADAQFWRETSERGRKKSISRRPEGRHARARGGRGQSLMSGQAGPGVETRPEPTGPACPDPGWGMGVRSEKMSIMRARALLEAGEAVVCTVRLPSSGWGKCDKNSLPSHSSAGIERA
ncbi:unnamed protein product [Protopolystoma xenopodis]|uniref:Uncharacterized protein n=1 Tax=Protopolystoma xenopodis TaxID=117903 RepID=A0A448WDN9_9PLAT|nr:unnamed protein product [Protopolystoma xenopodis]